jgi:hypothetical protein
MAMSNNLSRKIENVPNLLTDKNLFGEFDLSFVEYNEDYRYEFNSYVNRSDTQCILVLPKPRFIDSPRCVWLILDKYHTVGLDPRKVSPWFTSPNNTRAVLLSKGDFSPNRIKRVDKGFVERGVCDELPDSLTYEYWRSMVGAYKDQPWVNIYGWLYM